MYWTVLLVSEPVKLFAVKIEPLSLNTVNKPGYIPPTYDSDGIKLPVISYDADVYVTEPVIKFVIVVN